MRWRSSEREKQPAEARDPGTPGVGEGASPAGERPMLVLRPASGVALEPALRGRMEQRMGLDLGHVRVHTDSTAASLAFQLRANAFTVGPHLFFAAGRFEPQTRHGLALLAHELTHVRQQPGGMPLLRGALTETRERELEREARAEEQATHAGTFRSFPASGAGVSPSGLGDRSGRPVRAAVGAGPELLPPVLFAWGERHVPVAPLRQPATDAPAEPPAAPPAAPPGTAPAAPPPETPPPDKLAEQVYEWIQRRLRLESEQRGIQRWH